MRNIKIYTKVLSGFVDMASGVTTDEPSADSWLLQEDIEVIGVGLFCRFTHALGNDGDGSVTAELSQVAKFEVDGTIALITAVQDWNTTPAFGQIKNKDLTVMFPPGYAVSVKEEGYLHLNMHATASGTIPGGSRGGGHAVIYYIKKTLRDYVRTN